MTFMYMFLPSLALDDRRRPVSAASSPNAFPVGVLECGARWVGDAGCELSCDHVCCHHSRRPGQIPVSPSSLGALDSLFSDRLCPPHRGFWVPQISPPTPYRYQHKRRHPAIDGTWYLVRKVFSNDDDGALLLMCCSLVYMCLHVHMPSSYAKCPLRYRFLP